MKRTDELLEQAKKAESQVRETAQRAEEQLKTTAKKAGDEVKATAKKAGTEVRATAKKAGTHVKRAIMRTRMLNMYYVKFACRIIIFIGVLGMYLFDRSRFELIVARDFFHGITVIHILWAIFMVIMVFHLTPFRDLSMALRKRDEANFVPVDNYSEIELLRFVQDQNVRAWTVLLVWLLFNSIFGLLFLFGIIGETDLVMLTVFYFLCDYICILIFCPFQTHIMKNRCCVNCRIYDWGHFMMFTPMLFIRNFFSWSLFFMSVIVLIHWELIYAKHPERFWRGSNRTLQCADCRDKTCQIKRRIQGGTPDTLP